MKKLGVKQLLPLTVAGTVAVLTACQVGVPTKTASEPQTTIGGNINSDQKNVIRPSTPEGVATNPNLANPNLPSNATVKGRLLDTEGNPIADAVVFTASGHQVLTDAQGNYSLPVAAEAGKDVIVMFRKSGFIYSSETVTINPGDTALIDKNVKKMDGAVNFIKADVGGTFSNSTGVLEVDVPPGALTGNVTMVLTPLAYGQAGTANELPGPLETVDENGQRLLLMPVEYWSIDMTGGTIKEGESLTMRMRIPDDPNRPFELKNGDMIPCYIYDPALGYWNSPNLGPVVEKDGALWATYEIKPSALNDRTQAARTVQHYFSNGGSDDQMAHNAMHDRENATNVLGSGQWVGIEGGHTFVNVFGTTMHGKVTDWDGSLISGATVTASGASRGGSAVTRTQSFNGTEASFGFLEYRNRSVTYSARIGEVSGSVSVTTPTNTGPFPPNQFGRRGTTNNAGETYEQRSPEYAALPNIQLDTRHPVKIKLFTDVPVDPAKVTVSFDGASVASGDLTIDSSAKTILIKPRKGVRGTEHTVSVSLAASTGEKKFTIPNSQEWRVDKAGAVYSVEVPVVGGAK